MRPLIRSLLYVPASSERFIAKAHECGSAHVGVCVRPRLSANMQVASMPR